MKRSLGALGFFLSAAFMTGCPVYSDNVLQVECVFATDCPIGYRCTSGGLCVQAPTHGTGSDAGVTEGGTTEGGTTEGGAHDALIDAAKDTALDTASGDARTTDGAIDAPSSDAAPVVFCGNPNDCAADETCSTDGVCHRGNCSAIPCINQYQCAVTASGPACVHGDSKGCSADRQCLANESCVDGHCTAVAELCTDRAQCGMGKVCADGRCTTACTTDGQCSTGYLCRTALGICGAKAAACVHTQDCGSKDQVCVDGACVPRCAAIGACGTGGVCVDNGCVPSVKPVVECNGEGASTECTGGSICLHHHCYASCVGDAGLCGSQPSAPVCKQVTITMAHSVCGTTETLGSDCDPTAAKACAGGQTCIDGYCR